jgi:hypothetical protein
VGLSIVQLAVRQLLGFNPATLFAAGEQGAWYDPSDMSTLFQDSAGTTPVTAVEQPVGRMLDKSGRGNHAAQSTSASRPVLSALINRLVSTETLATQTITTMATTQRLRFEGTGTITLSGTATGTYSAGSHTFTTTAGSLTLTVSGSVTKADLRVANDGVGLPAYQRVNTSTDYDTTGFPMYLRFDGVDDSLSTSSINFTSTDKMTVFAGVRKLSDAANGVLAELSVDANANNGAFELRAPSGGLNDLFARFRGTATVFVNPTVAAPVTRVIAVTDDISGDSLVMRLNGTQAASNTADQGTGNFGNYPLYIGRRGGTTLPFNGRFYSLIVRGAQSTAAQIAATETYVNSRTKAY